MKTSVAAIDMYSAAIVRLTTAIILSTAAIIVHLPYLLYIVYFTRVVFSSRVHVCECLYSFVLACPLLCQSQFVDSDL